VHELRGSSAPLILFGVKAVDDDQQQVGPMVATLLGRPCVTSVADFKVGDGRASCHREVEGGVEVVEVELPAVLTITKGAFEPRYASLKGIMAAKKKEMKVLNLEDLGLGADQVGTNGALCLVSEVFIPERESRVEILSGSPAEAVARLIEKLRKDAKVI
jgi:electron transfer flavoprotein beta subunit